MPTYEYRCTDCGQHLEVVQAFTDDALTTCPNCEGRLRKVFGSIGITFKGSGFYKTDSRKTSSVTSKGDGAAKGDTTTETKKDTPSSSSESSSGSSSSESSSAAKTA